MSNFDRTIAKSAILHQLSLLDDILYGGLSMKIDKPVADFLQPLAKAAGYEFVDQMASDGSAVEDMTIVDLIVKLVELDCDEYSFAGTSQDIKHHLRTNSSYES